MAKNKTTDMARKLAPFITGMASDVSEETAIKEIEAVLQALETHKGSADHDDDPHKWTALNEFFQVLGVVGLTPLNQTSDIGSVTNLFAKGYFAELSTLIFKKENVLVMDGTFVITKQSGKFPSDVSATDTQIDFGQNLTVGDFLLLRAEGKQEFMRVGTKVSGTKYNVTRNLDGTGADSWPAQSVYFVRGHQGDGWLELTATDDQRFSVFVQGAAWNNTTEIGRFGKLDGWQGAGLTGYGIAIGNYASGIYYIYTPTTGVVVSNGGGGVRIDSDGLTAKNRTTGTMIAPIKIIHNQDGSDMITFSGGWGVGNMAGRIELISPESLQSEYTMFTLRAVNKNNGVQTATAELFLHARNDGGKSATFNCPLDAQDITYAPAPHNIPRADATGKLDAGWLPTTHDDHGQLTGLADDDHTQYTKHPKSSTDNAIVRWDGTGGRTIQDSGVTIDDSNNIKVGTAPVPTSVTSSTDNAIVRFDGTGGNKIQNSGVTIDDNGKLSGNGLDGWIYDTDTWSYVSATSFKITGKDVRYKFPKGTKIKLVQSGSTKYFYVVATAYTSGDTIITITGGSDYTLASATISGQAYSYAAAPQSFPQWFNWTPTFTGFSTVPTGIHKFSVIGSTCFANIRESSGTSNSTAFAISAPITPLEMTYFPIRLMDSGAWGVNPGLARINTTGVIDIYKDLNASATTNTGSKYAQFMCSYEF